MSVKDEIRYKLKIKRKYFCGVRREFADGAILDNFLNAFLRYESFFVYNSFSTEADTKGIIAALLDAGKKVYLPRVDGDKMVAVPYGETSVGAFGINEPAGKPYNGNIDVTVIPLLAVNGRGFRIGYGKGFYDRYLSDKRTLKVGLGYGFQIEIFEEEKHDIPLDLFLCEKGIYYYET